MKKVKIGLVGGGMIHHAHMQAYIRRTDVEVIAISALPEHVKDFAQLYSIPKTYTDMEKLMKDPDIDLVDIAVPVYLHEKAAILAAEEGKGVICEKPLGRNAKEAKNMLDAVEKNKVFNAYLENYTFFPKVEEAKKLMDGGVIGKPTYASASGGNMGPNTPWFYDKNLSGGGCLIDLGVHSIEIGRWLLGKKNPDKVFAYNDVLVNEKAKEGNVEDTSIILLKFNKFLYTSMVSWGIRSGGEGMTFEVHGTEGTISSILPNGFPLMRIFTSASEEKLNYLKESTMSEHNQGWFLPSLNIADIINLFIMEMENVISSYTTNSEPRHTFYDGWVNNMIMDALYYSAESEKWINLNI